jgi:hypothetical protein
MYKEGDKIIIKGKEAYVTKADPYSDRIELIILDNDNKIGKYYRRKTGSVEYNLIETLKKSGVWIDTGLNIHDFKSTIKWYKNGDFMQE